MTRHTFRFHICACTRKIESSLSILSLHNVFLIVCASLSRAYHLRCWCVEPTTSTGIRASITRRCRDVMHSYSFEEPTPCCATPKSA
ncbi:hypothetical protein KP509_08G049700 [Ceratopteris richardii]|uniref:Uncharacterized protein n=1 Tax=Ceratopteris richardii TaxID=49495 RepID=A0A8T2U6M8_CERRI|nr:hypothetical protein KP509_08G049700 [Ceratopteris richardii]